MTRSKKMLYNTITSLLLQVVTLICGFILPRMFLSYYGSSVNGLVSSITQFLGFITLAECGVGAVVQSSLYKPLAINDKEQISRIYLSSEKFFKKIAFIFIVYIILLMIFYPMVTAKDFDYGYTVLLILAISISSFSQYYIGITYRLLLNADQLGFIQFSIQIIALILNSIFSIILMKKGLSIQVVKLSTSIFFLIQPLLISFIAKQKYKINHDIVLTTEPIKQKWNGLAQHIAWVVLNNTDIIVLTLMSTLNNVSIYTVYNLVVSGLKQLISSLTNGTQAMFGNMIANNEVYKLKHSFEIYECLFHIVVTFIFSVTLLLIVPFIQVYTNNITDANYVAPVFAFLITIAQMAYCLRLPYNAIVLAAGHYRQTQASALIEAIINIGFSVLLVHKLGLTGVAIGTLLAMTYRTFYLVHYLSKNIIQRRPLDFFRHLLVDALIIVIMIISSRMFGLSEISYSAWIFLGIEVSSLSILVTLSINLLFYKSLLLSSISVIRNRFF